MSKIRLPQSKHTLIAIAILSGLVIILVINLAVVVPSLVQVFLLSGEGQTIHPVDVNSVNVALDLIK